MWLSKKKWQALEKRVADLEGHVQGQLPPKETNRTKVKEWIKEAMTDAVNFHQK